MIRDPKLEAHLLKKSRDSLTWLILHPNMPSSDDFEDPVFLQAAREEWKAKFQGDGEMSEKCFDVLVLILCGVQDDLTHMNEKGPEFEQYMPELREKRREAIEALRKRWAALVNVCEHVTPQLANLAMEVDPDETRRLMDEVYYILAKVKGEK